MRERRQWHSSGARRVCETGKRLNGGDSDTICALSKGAFSLTQATCHYVAHSTATLDECLPGQVCDELMNS